MAEEIVISSQDSISSIEVNGEPTVPLIELSDDSDKMVAHCDNKQATTVIELSDDSEKSTSAVKEKLSENVVLVELSSESDKIDVSSELIKPCDQVIPANDLHNGTEDVGPSGGVKAQINGKSDLPATQLSLIDDEDPKTCIESGDNHEKSLSHSQESCNTPEENFAVCGDVHSSENNSEAADTPTPSRVVSPIEEKPRGDNGEQINFPIRQITKVVNCHRSHVTSADQRRLLCLTCKTRICPICYCNFTHHLRHHLKAGNITVYCNDCGIPFFTLCALKAHQRIHKVKPPFVCPDCGALYTQLRFFIAHCLERCFHLFTVNEYVCEKCGRVCTSLEDFRRHQRTHILCHFICRLCGKSISASRQQALRHVTAEHQRDNSEMACALEVGWTCEYCGKRVRRNHWNEHEPTPTRTMLQCLCGVALKPTTFFSHRERCKQDKALPAYWEAILNKDKAADDKASQDDEQRVCKSCSSPVDNGKGCCSTCQPRPKMTMSNCHKCGVKFKVKDGVGENTCGSCFILTSRGKRACRDCGTMFKPFGREKYCEECRGVISEWLGREEVIGEEDDIHESCELIYPSQPEDHIYCLPHEFLEKAKNEYQNQLITGGFSFFKIAGAASEDELEKPAYTNSKQASSDVGVVRHVLVKSKQQKCFLCGSSWAKTLYGLLVHINKCHRKGVLPIMVKDPMFFTKKEIKETVEDDKEDMDLMTRLKKLKENAQQESNNINDAEDKSEKSISTNHETSITPKKRMRLYIPKNTTHEKQKYLPAKCSRAEKEINQEKSNDKNIEFKKKSQVASPQKKEHEFWDGFYEALWAVDGRNQPKAKKEELIENIPFYSNKRQVKKPKRFVDELEEESQGSCKRNRSDCNSPLSGSQEKKSPPKNKESAKKDCESSAELKSKKKDPNIDFDLVEVQNKMKKDDEIGFIAKTFDSESSNATPHKRRRKLASKLAYLMKMNESDATEAESGVRTCIICRSAFEDASEFRHHVMTHRTDDDTFQCMECGECFVVRPSLEKHLHAFHKIQDIARYIEENHCNMKLNRDTEAKDLNLEKPPNQCKVCKQVFPCALDLNKHFRIHGMAFLQEAQKENKLT